MSQPQEQLALVELGLLVLSVGLSILAGQILKDKIKSPIEDDKPTTLSTRGSFTNWWIGIRRLGPVFSWAGDREVIKEEVGGGKGFGGPEQDVYYEAGWHVLGVGPVLCLHQIIQGGKVIFNGPITADSHPSGSTIALGKEGNFTIYWGEQDQPVNTFLGNASRVTVSSRWPFLCYIVWNKKRLGTSPNWPLLDYVMERRPQVSETYLSNSAPWYDPVPTLDGPIVNITGSLASSFPTVGYLEVLGDQSLVFKPKTLVAISGNGIPDGDLEVRAVQLVVAGGGFSFSTTTRIFFQEATAGANSSGTLQTYSYDDSAGANIAHAAVDMLFAPFPMGVSFDVDGYEPWDIDSFEDLGVEAETDGWRASIYASEGENVQALFGAMLQDHGAMLPINTETGKLQINRVRFPVGAVPTINDDVFSDELSEREVYLGHKPVDKLVFEFVDRALQFATATIAIDDDGQGFFYEHQRARKVPIVSTVHFFTAAKLGELRSPEELADGAEFRLSCSREARELLPGTPLLVSGFEEVLRVIGVEADPLSERVIVRVIPDFYGAPKTDFENSTGGGQPVIDDPEQDEQFAVVEIPEQLNDSGILTVIVPHIRANGAIINAAIHLSRDNTTYTLWGTDSLVQTGGVLTQALPASGPTWVPAGPEFTALGPDNSTLSQDLSADPVNFGLGRQLCVIVSSAGTEICYLQKSTVVSGDTRRLDGLLRARYDTRKLSHPIGAQVYIFDQDVITPINDPLLEIGENLYVKTQPATTAGSVVLAGVAPTGKVLVGKGEVPIAPDYVQVVAPLKNVSAYRTGQSVTVRAVLSSALSSTTGAGFQSAGTAIGLPTIPGTVLFEMLNLGDVLVDQKSGTSLEQTWSNAEIIAALGSEVGFKIRVTHIVNSLSSNTAQVTVSKL